MGNANPVGCMFTAMLFGLFYALSNHASTFNMPSQLFAMLPYVATMVGLVIYSARQKAKKAKKLNKE